MNNDIEHLSGCSEKFAELCALSTSGELSAEELAILEEHVAACASCASLLREYTSLANVGMAKLAAEFEGDSEIQTPLGYDEEKIEARFTEAFRADYPVGQSKLRSATLRRSNSARWAHMKRQALLIGTAAALLICVGGAFELGRRTTNRNTRSHTGSDIAVQPFVAPDGEKARLKIELTAAQASLETISAKSSELERKLRELSDTRASLVEQIGTLKAKDNSEAASLSSVTQQRDNLQQQLNDTSNALTRAREDLSRAQEDRQGILLRVATLETEVNHLHAELAATNNSAGNDEKFLAADRDIRELMGARQLYIADVFDVQKNGERSKPFGRVFYTKGKSLIFYAFDLQKQPGYHEANAFQAWGKPANASAKPISLGIFYEDSEQNRRWVVKSDSPDILAQINAVFVTVEPHGGSATPTGKPFLEAYLHSLPPNHP